MEKDNRYSKELEKLKENIRKIRKGKGHRSAESFAEALGVSLKTVQGWENMDNGRWPDLVMMLKVCDLTGYSLLGRIQEPTHEIKFIHEKTGLSVEAIEKLIALKGTGKEDLVSDIITHNNAARLLRLLLLASDEDEIAWLKLDEIPRDLMSTYAEKPIDFSVGIGSDVADYLVSQEMVSIIRSIREQHEKEKEKNVLVNSRYEVYKMDKYRQKMLERLEDDGISLSYELDQSDDPERAEWIVKRLKKISKLTKKIRIASLREWEHENIEKEYNDMYRGEENENG